MSKRLGVSERTGKAESAARMPPVRRLPRGQTLLHAGKQLSFALRATLTRVWTFGNTLVKWESGRSRLPDRSEDFNQERFVIPRTGLAAETETHDDQLAGRDDRDELPLMARHVKRVCRQLRSRLGS